MDQTSRDIAVDMDKCETAESVATWRVLSWVAQPVLTASGSTRAKVRAGPQFSTGLPFVMNVT
jgi:hypothetical protein